ncbi:MAG: 5-oxoprolinase subunit PxpB [Selenomonadaceae bacterium]
MSINFSPLGEAAILVSFGSTIAPAVHDAVRSFSYALERQPFAGMTEYIAAYTSVTIFYDPVVLAKETLLNPEEGVPYSYQVAKLKAEAIVRSIDDKSGKSADARVVRVPVCYGGEYGPDLADVARYHKMTEQDVIETHTSGDYLIYMIGFAPGFPYVGGLPKSIATPRKKSPRLIIPEGSVGIAGEQTGIYPIATPGGWQLIGRTPLSLFRPDDDDDPTLLHAGDKLEFYAITADEYDEIKRAEDAKKGGDAS